MRHFLLKLLYVLLLLFVFQNSIKADSPSDSFYKTGIEFLRIPDYQQAYYSLKAALSVCKSESNRTIEVQACMELGKLYILFSKYDSAIYFLNKGKGLSQKFFPGEKWREAAFQMELGNANEERGDIEIAGECYRKAVAGMESSLDIGDMRRAMAYSAYSRYFTFKQQPDSELYYSNRAFNAWLATKERSPKYACPILIQHATATKEFYCQHPDSFQIYFPRIRSYYRQALQIAKSYYRSCSFEEGKALQGLANTYTDCIRGFYSKKRPDADANWR
ncbi:MAG: hypothetical protein RIQ47_758, partial [Bacteroidota bacterium]